MDEAVKDVVPKYWGNVLSSFEAGVMLDLRARLAVDFLKAPGLIVGTPGEAAKIALDLASELLEQAAARGLVKDLPANGEITASMRHHIDRSVAAGAYQAQASNRAARDVSSIVPPHPAMSRQ